MLTRDRRRDARRRARWTREHAGGHRLLEVGAGAGFFLESAAEQGFDAIGIELSDRAAGYGRSELGVDLQGFFGLLQAARAQLGPCGRLLLEVPNVDSVGADILRGRWAHLDPDAHVSHFAPGSLATALDAASFSVLHLSTLIEGYYDRPAFRMRPRRIAGRAVRAARLRTLRLTHPDGGELLRAVAERAA